MASAKVNPAEILGAFPRCVNIFIVPLLCNVVFFTSRRFRQRTGLIPFQTLPNRLVWNNRADCYFASQGLRATFSRGFPGAPGIDHKHSLGVNCSPTVARSTRV